MILKNIFGHLKTIVIHKWWVFIYCCKMGIPAQGFLHDMSKFSPIEFFESVKFYQGGKSSPILAAKKVQGYSLAWQHHKGRNPHHHEYWTDNYSQGTTTIDMPYKYVLELIADYLAAGRTYNGKSFTIQDEYIWWIDSASDRMKISSNTKFLIDDILKNLSEDESYFKKIKHQKLK